MMVFFTCCLILHTFCGLMVAGWRHQETRGPIYILGAYHSTNGACCDEGPVPHPLLSCLKAFLNIWQFGKLYFSVSLGRMHVPPVCLRCNPPLSQVDATVG